MKGITIDCEVLYFATFRKPSTTSLILSYSIPPFTTIRGMLSNALGLAQDDLSLQEKIKIGIQVVEAGDKSGKNVEMAKILKLKEGKVSHPSHYPSSPMFKEFLIKPKYRLFVAGDDETICEIHYALNNLKRPLYLGQSDDLVDLNVSEIIDVEEVTSNSFHSVVEGVHPGGVVENIPYVFNKEGKDYSIQFKLVSVPLGNSIKTDELLGYSLGDFRIQLY